MSFANEEAASGEVSFASGEQVQVWRRKGGGKLCAR